MAAGGRAISSERRFRGARVAPLVWALSGPRVDAWMCIFGCKKGGDRGGGRGRVMRVGSMVRRPVSHACDARALEYVIRWQLVSMAEVVTQQSAAVRRLAALMQRDDDEAEQARQAELEQERQRAAAAQKAAAEHGVDPKTKRQIKYCAGKLYLSIFSPE